MTFKDENLAMQHLARELMLIREHNKRFKEGDPQDTLMLHAEAGLVCMALEHFVRVLLGPDALDKDTMKNLLEKAVKQQLVDAYAAEEVHGLNLLSVLDRVRRHEDVDVDH
jgi:hypothetical protein